MSDFYTLSEDDNFNKYMTIKTLLETYKEPGVSATAEPELPPEFIQSDSDTDAPEGYEFKEGSLGKGYYRTDASLSGDDEGNKGDGEGADAINEIIEYLKGDIPNLEIPQNLDDVRLDPQQYLEADINKVKLSIKSNEELLKKNNNWIQ